MRDRTKEREVGSDASRLFTLLLLTTLDMSPGRLSPSDPFTGCQNMDKMAGLACILRANCTVMGTGIGSPVTNGHVGEKRRCASAISSSGSQLKSTWARCATSLLCAGCVVACVLACI